jgi:hypothetical protein
MATLTVWKFDSAEGTQKALDLLVKLRLRTPRRS